MKKHKIFLLVASMLTLAGCTEMSNTFDSNYSSYQARSNSEYYKTDQQVTYDAYATFETKNYEKDSKSIMDAITEKGGKIESQNNNLATNYSTDFVGTELSIVAQIPKDNFESLLEQLKKDYTVQSFSLSSQDITDDISSTNETIETLKTRLAEVEEKLKDEKLTFNQKETLETEKQNLEDQIKSMEKQNTNQVESVEYSTLTLNLREVDYYTSEGRPFWLPFLQAFKYFFQFLAWGVLFGLVAAFAVTPFLFVGSLAYLLIRKHQYKMFQKLKAKMDPKGVYNEKSGNIKVDQDNNIHLDGEEK